MVLFTLSFLFFCAKLNLNFFCYFYLSLSNISFKAAISIKCAINSKYSKECIYQFVYLVYKGKICGKLHARFFHSSIQQRLLKFICTRFKVWFHIEHLNKEFIMYTSCVIYFYSIYYILLKYTCSKDLYKVGIDTLIVDNFCTRKF